MIAWIMGMIRMITRRGPGRVRPGPKPSQRGGPRRRPWRERRSVAPRHDRSESTRDEARDCLLGGIVMKLTIDKLVFALALVSAGCTDLGGSQTDAAGGVSDDGEADAFV